MIDLIKDLWAFMQARKKFWLAPIIFMLVLLGLLVVFAQGSAFAPFIYTILLFVEFTLKGGDLTFAFNNLNPITLL